MRGASLRWRPLFNFKAPRLAYLSRRQLDLVIVMPLERRASLAEALSILAGSDESLHHLGVEVAAVRFYSRRLFLRA
jgi:hypothetical protein